jgi:hypothetical protein
MNWLRALEEAPSADAVIEVVNDYLADRPPSFWSVIPAQAQPGAVADEAELHRWHHQLVQELTAARAPHVHLQDLCVFFVRASVRVHQIALRAEFGGSSNDRDFSARRCGPTS